VFYHWPKGWCEEELRLPETSEMSNNTYDVVILGAGVVGCALAYKLSQYDLRLLIIDKNHDVGEGTSKANSAIIHTGFDSKPGTLESQLVVRASSLWPEYSQRLRIPLRKTSALVLAMNQEEKDLLPTLLDQSLKNGVRDIKIISGEEVMELEANVSPQVVGALSVERESIIDPFATPIAYAEVAVVNGATLILGLEVRSVDTSNGDLKTINCSDGWQFKARHVINAAGLGSPAIGETYQAKRFEINPRRGQLVIYDKIVSNRVTRILLPMPTPITKGILIAPTIFGNLIAGPTAEDLPEGMSYATETTAEGLELIRTGVLKLCPGLAEEPVISSYAGLRCNCKQGQYQVQFNDGHRGIVTLTGIRSTGLTSSIALAEYIVDRMHSECGLERVPDRSAIDFRPKEAMAGWDTPRPYEDPERLRRNPDYALMVCFCEQISRGEIIGAANSPLKPRTIDAIRRRTRAATGRCQSFYCFATLAEIISRHVGVQMDRITKKGPGSEIIARPIQEILGT
jgi:glycerol-3-phosphate dehydrogenase